MIKLKAVSDNSGQFWTVLDSFGQFWTKCCGIIVVSKMMVLVYPLTMSFLPAQWFSPVTEQFVLKGMLITPAR